MYGNDWKQAFAESLRVLKKGGYLFLSEAQVEQMNPESTRTEEAEKIAKLRFIDDIQNTIDGFLEHILELTVTYQMERSDSDPAHPQQKGDTIKERLLIYQK